MDAFSVKAGNNMQQLLWKIIYPGGNDEDFVIDNGLTIEYQIQATLVIPMTIFCSLFRK